MRREEEDWAPYRVYFERMSHRSLGRSTLAGILWLPALLVVLTVAIWLGQLTHVELPAWTGLLVIGLLFWGFVKFARSGKPEDD